MLHFVHPLDADFVSLTFGAGQEVYIELIRAFFVAENGCLLHLETTPMREQ